MLFSSRAIVIKTLKYSETSVIARLYTERFGMQSYLIKGIRSSKRSTFSAAQLLSLNLLEIVAYHKQGTQLQHLKEMRCQPAFTHLHNGFAKTAVALYMAELLYRCIQEEEPNERLFDFLFNSIRYLDETPNNLANFPSWFTLQLSRFLGFWPGETSERENMVFDMGEGSFKPYDPNEPGDFIPLSHTPYMQQLVKASMEDQHLLKIPSSARSELLEYLLRYYQIHQLNTGEMKSHKVLAEVLG